MRRIVVVGLVGGAVVVTAVVLTARRTPHSPLDGEPDWVPLTLAGPDVRAGAPTADDVPVADDVPAVAAGTGWIAPDTAGDCPGSHPVKATRSSRIYHVPGGQFYGRTKAERCYCDAATAEADGYRAAKR
jgi:hypothetical protein